MFFNYRVLRRTRGWLLRLAVGRWGSALAGGVLTMAFVTLRAVDFAWESWLSDGVGMLLGATGLALLLVAAGGRRPDWIDPSNNGR